MWEEDSTWLEYDVDCEAAFCKVCRRSGRYFREEEKYGLLTNPFTN